MRLNSIIYENFYPDPFLIRNKLLKQEFYPADYLHDTIRTEELDNDDVVEIGKIGNFCDERTIRASKILPEADEYTRTCVNQYCKFSDETKLEVDTYFTLQTKDHDNVNEQEIDGDKDDLYDKAVDIIKSEGKASTSFLQRKLQIGYNRAARIMETMEKEGIVGQANHVGKREIL